MWDISIRQALSVYSDLIRAMNGEASHGTDVEIYAYRLLPNMPTEHMDINDEEKQDAYMMAQIALSGLCHCLEKEFDCTVEINGVNCNFWRSLQPGFVFDHRVMVSVAK